MSAQVRLSTWMGWRFTPSKALGYPVQTVHNAEPASSTHLKADRKEIKDMMMCPSMHHSTVSKQPGLLFEKVRKQGAQKKRSIGFRTIEACHLCSKAAFPEGTTNSLCGNAEVRHHELASRRAPALRNQEKPGQGLVRHRQCRRAAEAILGLVASAKPNLCPQP